MKTILLIGKNAGDCGRRLLNSVTSAVSVPEDGVFKTVRELCSGFQKIRGNVDVAVLLAESQKQLLDIVSLDALLENVRVILVLPDHVRETVSKGLRMRPRFMAHLDGNFDDITAVLKKMEAHETKRRRPESVP